ncbi:hypothetical protein MTO96_005137 [Rhipicephalus appendiculatus]
MTSPAEVASEERLSTPNRSPPRRPPVTQLEFRQAMRDFRSMFPEMEAVVIEAVLRANGGAVDASIDQLLAMATDNDNERLRTELEATENAEAPPALLASSGCAHTSPLPTSRPRAHPQPIRAPRRKLVPGNHPCWALCRQGFCASAVHTTDPAAVPPPVTGGPAFTALL